MPPIPFPAFLSEWLSDSKRKSQLFISFPTSETLLTKFVFTLLIGSRTRMEYLLQKCQACLTNPVYFQFHRHFSTRLPFLYPIVSTSFARSNHCYPLTGRAAQSVEFNAKSRFHARGMTAFTFAAWRVSSWHRSRRTKRLLRQLGTKTGFATQFTN